VSIDEHITIEVVHAQPNQVIERYYQVVPFSTVVEVLRLAAADPAFAGIDIANAAVGVFGRVVHAGHVLSDRDRIEIYRPLAADPKNARRARVRQARRQMKK
jgi:putative ubiquitin-RnfH superfamily antitoxin RatB of RatAB toxin-antitoxin module